MTQNATSRSGFTNSFGVIMAAAGSAVGLGNIWRFPYICGKYGGAAFLLIYLAFVFFIGMVLLMSEFTIGRRTRRAPVQAFPMLRDGERGWRWIGIVGIFTCFLILAIYLVISGWTLNYFWESLSGQLLSVGENGYEQHFADFATSPFRPAIFLLIFLLLSFIVILCGVEKGIEKVSKLLMPLLLVLVVAMCVRSVTLGGASEGMRYLFQPDFSKLGWEGVLAALGQALFSLSVGMGAMIVYGSYIPEDDNILKSSLWITVCDVLIAVLAGIAIFPAVFATGQNPAGGPGLVYMVLPAVFNSFGTGGGFFAVVFFLLLSLAALTSAISLHETLTAFLSDCGKKRWAGAFMVTVAEAILAVITALAYDGGILDGNLLGRNFFGWMDYFTGTILPPICALLTILFFGWVMNREAIKDELSNHGTVKVGWFEVYYHILVRFVAPIALLFVLIKGIIG